MGKYNMTAFTIYGNPKALKRHRTTKSGHTYDPSKDDKENLIAQAVKHRPEKPLEGSLSVRLMFVFPRPKSHYNKAGIKPDAPYSKISKPDLTNLAKLVEDALNGIFWKDDAQITSLVMSKMYGEIPQTYIEVRGGEEC
jgi:Holliday junction resolvase RusA-like endonuclease